MNGIDLIDGWYHKKCKHPISIHNYPISTPKPISTPLGNVKTTTDYSIKLNSMKMNVANLIISSNSCNDLKELNLNEYQHLKSIEIGDDCFENVELFNIDGLNELKSLKIGSNSFTLLKSSNWDSDKANNANRSFSILYCDELESIEIGVYSVSDYGGEFELKNLPKLDSITIGIIEWGWSLNFFWSSFVIKGIIDMI